MAAHKARCQLSGVPAKVVCACLQCRKLAVAARKGAGKGLWHVRAQVSLQVLVATKPFVAAFVRAWERPLIRVRHHVPLETRLVSKPVPAQVAAERRLVRVPKLVVAQAVVAGKCACAVWKPALVPLRHPCTPTPTTARGSSRACICRRSDGSGHWSPATSTPAAQACCYCPCFSPLVPTACKSTTTITSRSRSSNWGRGGR